MTSVVSNLFFALKIKTIFTTKFTKDTKVKPQNCLRITNFLLIFFVVFVSSVVSSFCWFKVCVFEGGGFL